MKIKENPEDFEVEEVPIIKLKEKGAHKVYMMTKRDISTQKAIEEIKKRYNLKNKQIGYAGAKDKRAVTKQWISIKWNKPNKTIELPSIKLKLVGESNERILLGNLKGNKFKIKIKELNEDEIKELNKIKNKNEEYMPNYFGEQRFSKNNEKIGELIIKRKFREAADMISKTEPKVKKFIDEKPNDSLGAIRQLPRQTALIYIHSFQSLIFNKALSRIIENYCTRTASIKLGRENLKTSRELEKLKFTEIPIIGFGTKINGYKDDIKRVTKEIMEEYAITEKDFLIREAPDLSVEGTTRKAVVEIKNLSIRTNSKEKTALLQFELPKGSYATVAIKQLTTKIENGQEKHKE